MEDWKPCSLILSHILDYTGYCGWVIDARRRYYSECGTQLSQELYQKHGDSRAHAFISGSKGEGLSNLLQSDTDVLFFNDHIVGTFEADNNADDGNIKDTSRYKFKVERDWSPPGYCILVLDSKSTVPDRLDKIIERSLSAIDKGVICLQGGKYLQCFSEEYKPGEEEEVKPIAGPAQPSTSKGYQEFDMVPTFSCPCSDELNDWYKRPRHHDWPSTSLQLEVISTPANVVATGSKESVFSELEWRFCFNRAEQKLMHSLNLTQSKVYVVLKMILKDHLKPEKKEITSYVMKNIVLWMCELNPSSSFTPSTLLSWIYVGLQTLKCHIEAGHLSYYMIPARNLLEGKFLDDVTKSLFLHKVSKLLESGVGFVHVCETIKMGLDLYSDGLLEDYGWKRNRAEICAFNGESVEVKVKRELLCLAGVDVTGVTVLLPDLDTLAAQGCTVDGIFKLYKYRVGLFLNKEKAKIYAESD